MTAPARRGGLPGGAPRLRGRRLRRPCASSRAAAGLDDRDRALAQRIAYGTVQRMRTIDHGIDELGSRPAAELDPPVLAALRIAAYEVAWSEAPAHAVVNDAVELVREAGVARATGFTNAVARRLAEGFRRSSRRSRRAARRVLPRLDPRDLGARLRLGRGTCADARPERARRARRPLRRAGRRRRPTCPAPTALERGEIDGADGSADLAEPRLPARGARARLPRRRADPRRLRRAGREGDDAARPRSRRSSSTSAARASSRRTSDASGSRTSGS